MSGEMKLLYEIQLSRKLSNSRQLSNFIASGQLLIILLLPLEGIRKL